MKTVNIRNTVIGEGMPKICVPIVGTNEADLLNEIEILKQGPVDVVEWRMDWFEGIEDNDAAVAILKVIREALGDTPLLATFRTKNEGGAKALSTEEYVSLNKAIIASKLADLVDVELFTGDQEVEEIVSYAHDNSVYVVMSNHDFDKTPAYDEIISRLNKMQLMCADIPKIAVMPNSMDDVLTLLKATNDMSTLYADRPIITMSMGGMGAISRLCGQCFGSALTFGSAKTASAPGQVPTTKLKQVLQIIEESI